MKKTKFSGIIGVFFSGLCGIALAQDADGVDSAETLIDGAFGLILGNEFVAPVLDGKQGGVLAPSTIILSGYPATAFAGRDASGVFADFSAAVTPITNRVAAIYAMSDGLQNEQWCESTVEQLARILSDKYGEELNVISIVAFRRGDLHAWRIEGRQIALECRAFDLMSPPKVMITYADTALMQEFVEESFRIEQGEFDASDF